MPRLGRACLARAQKFIGSTTIYFGCRSINLSVDRDVTFHPEAKEFVAKQRKMFGEDVVVTYYADPHYGLTKFYLDAVRRADTDDKAAIMAVLPNQSILSGNGDVTLRASDRHVDLNILIASVKGGSLEMEEYIGKVVAPDQCPI